MRDRGCVTPHGRPVAPHGAAGRDIGSSLGTHDVMSEFQTAWDEVHAANTMGW